MFKTNKDDPEYKKYKKYIASKEFQAVKDIVFKRDDCTCCACGWNLSEYNAEQKSNKRTLQCHHKTYEHLYDELNHLEDLITICSVCHRAVHAAPSNIHRFKKSLDKRLDENKQ